MMLNRDALLCLIADLYAQLADAGEQIIKLQSEVATLKSNPKEAQDGN